MKEKLEKDPPQTTDELKRRVKTYWGQIDPAYLKKLAKSMKNRLVLVTAQHGGYIGY